MSQRIAEVMTSDPVVMDSTASLMSAAQAMRDHGIGDVVVVRSDGSPCGIVTDRDIVVNGLAAGLDPEETPLGEVCGDHLITLSPDDSVGSAVEAMQVHAIRRLPVVEAGRLVGIVSIGDLALERDPDSALAEISAAPANN